VLVQTADGSYTMYSKEFSQHYHSCDEGALNESLQKHIIPAFSYHKNKKTLHILDICFGLGYNTLTTLYYIKKHNLNINLYIYSVEFNTDLLHSLENFRYPNQFNDLKDIIKALSKDFYYQDDNLTIKIYNGDAREYLQNSDIKIDIVYQDPFSSDTNKNLWTVEYFALIKKLLNNNAIITTYSIATPIRLAMWENGLLIYEIQHQKKRSTIALNTQKINQNYKYIDMVLKQQRNKTAKAYKD